MATTRDEKLDEIRTVNREVPAARVAGSSSVDRDANPDAITGAPGSHPVGTGVGAAAAGAAGAAIGSVVPGIGTVIGGAVGAVVGAVAGGYAGKAVAESINPTDEHAYWAAEHRNRDYYDASLDYDKDYRAAYTTGIEVYNEDPARPYEAAQSDLRSRWDERRGQSKLDWDRASKAMRDVYDRERDDDDTASDTRASNTAVDRSDFAPGTSPTAKHDNPVKNL